MRLACGVAGILAGLIGAAIGILGIYDAATSRGSGEWSGLTTLFTYVIAVPAGLVAGVMAIFAKNKHVRLGCLGLALLSISLPFGSSYVRMKRGERYRMEIEQDLKRRYPELERTIEESRKKKKSE